MEGMGNFWPKNGLAAFDLVMFFIRDQNIVWLNANWFAELNQGRVPHLIFGVEVIARIALMAS